MNLLPLALQANPVTFSAFTPLLVAVGLWVAFVIYGLFSLRNHPKGLNPLFFTEMWERFSYYGMRALLLLYMTAPASAGGLGLSLKLSGLLYGLYTFFVYALSVPGGWIADRFLGYRKAVLVGGVLIALGEFALASGPLSLFYVGLAVIAVGTGLLKTNCTSIVGMLYDKNDPRQDGGYTIYYMGINIGALIAPLILGFMAQDPVFVAALGKVGLASANGWRWAFGFAGLAMVAGLVQYFLRQGALGDVGMNPNKVTEKSEKEQDQIDENRSRLPLRFRGMFHLAAFVSALGIVIAGMSLPTLSTVNALVVGVGAAISGWILYQSLRFNKFALILLAIRACFTGFGMLLGWVGFGNWTTSSRLIGGALLLILGFVFASFYKRVGSKLGEQSDLNEEESGRMWVVVILVFFIMIFFFVFEQAGTTLNLFADEHTRMSMMGFTLRSTWFQSVNSIWLLFLAPIFSWLWIVLKEKEPSSPIKFTLGLFFVGAGMLLLVLPSLAYSANPALKVSPWWLIGTYGLHTIGELCLSPVGLSTVSKLAPARYSGVMMGVFFFAIGAGNMLAGLAGGYSGSLKPATLFGGLFAITTIMALVLVALTPRIKRMMGGVH